jgi:hypothetical protein
MTSPTGSCQPASSSSSSSSALNTYFITSGHDQHSLLWRADGRFVGEFGKELWDMNDEKTWGRWALSEKAVCLNDYDDDDTVFGAEYGVDVHSNVYGKGSMKALAEAKKRWQQQLTKGDEMSESGGRNMHQEVITEEASTLLTILNTSAGLSDGAKEARAERRAIERDTYIDAMGRMINEREPYCFKHRDDLRKLEDMYPLINLSGAAVNSEEFESAELKAISALKNYIPDVEMKYMQIEQRKNEYN